MLALEYSARTVGHEVLNVIGSAAGPAASVDRPAAAPGGVGRGAVNSRPPGIPLAVSAAASRLVIAEEGIGP